MSQEQMADSAMAQYNTYGPAVFSKLAGISGVSAPWIKPAGGVDTGERYRRQLLSGEQNAIQRSTRALQGDIMTRMQRNGMLRSGQAQSMLAGTAARGAEQMGQASARYERMGDQRSMEAMRVFANMLTGNQSTAASAYNNVEGMKQQREMQDQQIWQNVLGAIGSFVPFLL